MRKFVHCGLVLGCLLFAAGCTVETTTSGNGTPAAVAPSAATTVAGVVTCLAPKENVCPAEQSVFARDTAEIFVTANLNGAAAGTKIDFAWRYVDGNQDIDTVTLTAAKAGNSALQASLPRPTFEGGWPAGNYEIRIQVQNHPEISAIKKAFSVK